MKKNNRGFSLLTVLMVGGALAVGIYSVSNYVLTESKLSARTALNEQARQGAESLLQLGILDVQQQVRNAYKFMPATPNSLLTLPTNFVNQFNSSSYTNKLVVDNLGSSEIIIGDISSTQLYYIDPLLAENETDILSGMNVIQKNIELLGKAKVEHPTAGSTTVHAQQVLSLREVPMFNYAVFYDVPLEISPGRTFEIRGKLHANHDAYISSNGNLLFRDRVTIAGDLYHNAWTDLARAHLTADDPVYFTNDEGVLVSMQEDLFWPSNAQNLLPGIADWVDTRNLSDEDFKALTDALWGKGLRTKVHGIEPLKALGFDDYVPETGKHSFNSNYQVIQPILNENKLKLGMNSTDPAIQARYEARGLVEKQKYAFKAGLTIEVDALGNRTYYTYARSGIDPYDGITYDAGTGEPNKLEFTINGSTLAAAGTDDTLTSHENFSYSINYTNGNKYEATVHSGFWDMRQMYGVNVIDLDIGQLRSMVEDNQASDWGGTPGSNNPRKPENWWNGVVYVKFPQQHNLTQYGVEIAPGVYREDEVNPAFSGIVSKEDESLAENNIITRPGSGWGLRLVNAEIIPDPTFAHDDGIYGMSIATNQILYVLGNYNADGNVNPSSSTYGEGTNDGTFATDQDEAPAALIADAVVFLSDNWDDARSATNVRPPSTIEISAAIVAGIVPTNKWAQDNLSGGLQNFPITLENSGNAGLYIRGSLVAWFESEVAKARWAGATRFNNDFPDSELLGKGLPALYWGHHKGFQAGKMPPGTPYLRAYRSSEFNIISKSEYDTRVAQILSVTPTGTTIPSP